jgi:hypothetical protein
VRETVLAHAAPTRIRRIHALIAEALEIAGAARHDPLTLVRHLEASGQAPRAAELAERAARDAAEQLAFDRAAELWGLALALGDHDQGERRALRRAQGEALAHAGRGLAAAEAYLAAAAGAAPEQAFECRRVAGEQLLLSGHVERGREILAGVLAEVGASLPPTPAAARRALAWSFVRLRLRGRRWRPRPLPTVPPAELFRLDLYTSISLGLAMIDNVIGADFQARALRLALDIGDPGRLSYAMTFQAMLLASRGGRGLAEAERLAVQARHLAQTSGDAATIAWADKSEGVVAYFAGRYQQAAEQLGAAEAAYRDVTMSSASELAHIRAFLLFALRRVGAYGELGRRYREFVRDAARRDDRYGETTLTRAANAVWLAEDDPARARAELEATTWTPIEGGYHLQHWFALRARVDLVLYERRAADDAMARELEAFRATGFHRLQVLRAENEWMAGRIALGRGDLDAATRSARRLARERAPFAAAWAAALDAALVARRGGRDESRVAALQLAALAAEHGQMPGLAAALRLRLGAALGGAGGDALAAGALRWLREQGVRRPERLADVLAPGG